LKFSPLGLIDVFNGNCIKIGAETKILNNIATSLEFGVYIPNKYTACQYARGINVKPELKVYLNKHKRTIGSFVSFEYQYKSVIFNYSDSIRLTINNTYFKTYTINKTVNCFTIKYGATMVSKKNFFFEYHFGIGVMLTNGYSNLSSEEVGKIYRPGDNSLIYSYLSTFDKATYPNIDAGIKLGFRIK
jgi:hypothetical protein